MNLLLVDDDRISINILADYIKPHLEQINEVICAYNGIEAYDIVISLKPDIIITDIKMPSMSGIDFIDKVQTIENYNPKVIFISGYRDFEYARKAIKLNVIDYILKPIDQDELIQRINSLTENYDGLFKKGNEDIINRVQKYLSNHLNDTLKLQEISKLFHYNAAYLGRLIKKETGYYYNDYVLKLRIIKAQSLLITTSDAINKIATEVGFKDPEHFTKRFKKVTGLTPSSYRNINQK